MAHRWGLSIVLVTLLGACRDDVELEPDHDARVNEAGHNGADTDAGPDSDAGANTRPHAARACPAGKHEPLSALCSGASCPDYATRREQLCRRNAECERDPFSCVIRDYENSCGGRSLWITIDVDASTTNHHYDASGTLIGIERGISVGICTDSIHGTGNRLRVDIYGDSCELTSSRKLDCPMVDADSGT